MIEIYITEEQKEKYSKKIHEELKFFAHKIILLTAENCRKNMIKQFTHIKDDIIRVYQYTIVKNNITSYHYLIYLGGENWQGWEIDPNNLDIEELTDFLKEEVIKAIKNEK